MCIAEVKMYFHLSLLFFYLLQIKAEPCITPGGEQGECLFIDDCPALAKAFTNPINGTETILRKFRCRRGNHFGVCCISGWNSINYGKELSDRRYCGLQHTDDYFPTTNTTGNTTSIDEFPWLAAIVETDPGTGEDKIVCHGSLINNRYILTAAHCVFHGHGILNNVSKVVLGKYHTKNKISCVDQELFGFECTEAQEFGIEEKIVHPFFFRYDALCDIALIRLNKTTSFTEYIRPICLPTQGAKFAEVGEILYTTGWGTVDLHSGQLATFKKKVKTILITSEECQKSYKNPKVSSTYHICTLDSANNTEFTCSGDGGAPVMFSYRNQWHIEGIVSKGLVCGAIYPGLHTRVSPYIDWIKQKIQP